MLSYNALVMLIDVISIEIGIFPLVITLKIQGDKVMAIIKKIMQIIIEKICLKAGTFVRGVVSYL